MLNILLPGQATLMLNLPGQATLKVEDAQHIIPRTGHTKDRGCSTYYSQDRPHTKDREMLNILLIGRGCSNFSVACPRTGHTKGRGCSTYYSQDRPH